MTRILTTVGALSLLAWAAIHAALAVGLGLDEWPVALLMGGLAAIVGALALDSLVAVWRERERPEGPQVATEAERARRLERAGRGRVA